MVPYLNHGLRKIKQHELRSFASNNLQMILLANGSTVARCQLGAVHRHTATENLKPRVAAAKSCDRLRNTSTKQLILSKGANSGS